MIKFEIPGRPVPMPRPRFANGRTHNTKESTAAKDVVGILVKQAMGHRKPYKGPVRLFCTFVTTYPSGMSKKARSAPGAWLNTKRPDVDNLVKLVMDGMNGIVYDDDAQVVDLSSKKIRGARNVTIVHVEPLTLDEMD